MNSENGARILREVLPTIYLKSREPTPGQKANLRLQVLGIFLGKIVISNSNCLVLDKSTKRPQGKNPYS